jgi:hypothetical protein
VAVLLGHHAGDDAAVAGQGLVHEVELVREVGLLERLPLLGVAAAVAGIDHGNENGQPDDRAQRHHPKANRLQLGPLGQDEPTEAVAPVGVRMVVGSRPRRGGHHDSPTATAS